MLNRLVAVIRREYLAQIKTRAFWIATCIVPIVMAALMIIPAWLATRGAGDFSIDAKDRRRHTHDAARDLFVINRVAFLLHLTQFLAQGFRIRHRIASKGLELAAQQAPNLGGLGVTEQHLAHRRAV